MQVVVLAGGFGTRLRPWTYEIPKPILPMLDKTLLEHVVEVVPSDKVDEVVVAGGYKVDDIEAYFKEADVSYDVRIVKETEPLGTGGALGNCRDVVSGQFVCLNGDIVSSLDMQVGLDLHQKNGGIGTLALWEVEDPTRFGIVGLDDEQRITQFKEKPAPEEVFSNLINAGSYLFEDDIFDYIPWDAVPSSARCFPYLLKNVNSTVSPLMAISSMREPRKAGLSVLKQALHMSDGKAASGLIPIGMQTIPSASKAIATSRTACSQQEHQSRLLNSPNAAFSTTFKSEPIRNSTKHSLEETRPLERIVHWTTWLSITTRLFQTIPFFPMHNGRLSSDRTEDIKKN